MVINLGVIGAFEILFLFIALFYTLSVKPTIIKVLVCFVFIFSPSLFVLHLGITWLFVTFIFISTQIAFYFFTNSFRASLDICFIVLGSIVAEHLSHILMHLIFLNAQPHNLYVYYLLFSTFYFMYVFLYKKFILEINGIFPLSLLARLFIALMSCSTVLIFYLDVMIPTEIKEDNIQRLFLFIQLIYFVLMAILFSILLTKLKKENDKMTKAQEQQLNYMHSLDNVNKEMRKFQHDYRNILLTMRGYLEIEDLTGLKKYFQTHILKAEEKTFFKNEVLINLDNLKIIELKGLLATKLLYADQIGILFNVEVTEIIENINMNIIDLTRIVGILTDNAIEASTQLENGQVNVGFIKTTHDSVMLIIENTTSNTNIKIDKLYEENFSTKGKDRGIGLSNVKEILERYPNVTLHTNIEDEWFIQELDIPVQQLTLQNNSN